MEVSAVLNGACQVQITLQVVPEPINNQGSIKSVKHTISWDKRYIVASTDQRLK